MSLSRNLLAGLANSIWTALIGLAVVPLYLKYLGIEAYGLIGFFTTTQALLSLLDMGLAPTMNREIARCSASGLMSEARNLLYTLSRVYWGMAVVIAIATAILSRTIGNHWLQSNTFSEQEIAEAILLMGLVIASRWPIGIYQGALMGAQRVAVSSAVSIVMVTISNLGGVAVLAYVSPTIQAFFIWQAIVGLVYAITMHVVVWRVIASEQNQKLRFDTKALQGTWRFTAGMSAIAILGIVFTQMDKIMLSKMLTLEDFGYYVLASIVVSGLSMIIMPFYNVLYPRFTALVTQGETKKLVDIYRYSTQILVTILFPAALFLAAFSEPLISVWTGNATVAAQVSILVTPLALGSALHGVMFIPHALQLASGVARLPLIINSILMIAYVPVVITLTLSRGAYGGAIAWLVLHVFYVLLGTWLTHRRLLKGIGAIWLLKDVGIPLLISIAAGLLGSFAFQATTSSTKLGYGFALTIATLILIALTSSRLRTVFWKNTYLKWTQVM